MNKQDPSMAGRITFAEAIARLCYSKGVSIEDNPYLPDSEEGKAWTREMNRLLHKEEVRDLKADYSEFTAE